MNWLKLNLFCYYNFKLPEITLESYYTELHKAALSSIFRKKTTTRRKKKGDLYPWPLGGHIHCNENFSANWRYSFAFSYNMILKDADTLHTRAVYQRVETSVKNRYINLVRLGRKRCQFSLFNPTLKTAIPQPVASR